MEPKKQQRNKSKLALACSAMLLSSLVFAQDSDGTITGRVAGLDGKSAVEGAIIRIQELGRETASSSDGRYRFNAIAPGTYTLLVDYLGAEEQTVTVVVEAGGTVNQLISLAGSEVEVIQVSGNFAGINSARNIQRAADGIKDIVDSSLTGRFADQNIAESLQRLPGVNIDRTEGEGRFVTIRGLGPEFNNVSINGVTVGTSSSGFGLTGSAASRAVALDVIPSDLLETIEVSKTRLPDQDGDSIGGAVNLKALSAYDKGGYSLGFRAEGSYNEKAGDTSPKFSFRWTDFLDEDKKWGLAVAASYFSRELEGDELRNDNGLREVQSFVDATSLLEIEDEDARPSFLRIEEVDQRREVGERDRLGATVNIDYRPTDNSEFFLRITATELEDADTRIQQEFEIRDAGDTANENLLIQALSGITTDGDIERQVFFQNSEEQVLTYALGGKHFIEDWTVDYQFARSENEFTNSGARARFRERDNALFYDISDPLNPIVGPFFGDPDAPPLSEASGSDIRGDSRELENFDFNEFLFINDLSNDDVTTFQFNAQYDTYWNDMPTMFKFGVKNQRREKSNDRIDEFNTGISDIDSITQEDLTDFTLFTPDSDLHGEEFRDFPNLGELQSVLFDNLDAARAAQEFNASGASNTFRGDYTSEEDIWAAYLMARIDVTDQLRVTAGFRVERTDFEGSAFVSRRIDAGDFEDVFEPTDLLLPPQLQSNDDSYTNVLPTVLIRYEPTDEIVIRSSYTEAVQRPSFFQFIPRLDIQSELEGEDIDNFSDVEVVTEVEAGNTGLVASEASQWDINFAWYPNETTYFSAGFFYKRIDDFFVNARLENATDIANFGIPADNFQLTTNEDVPRTITFDGTINELDIIVNGDEATVSGFEFSYSQQFANGIFIDSNFAIIDSEATLGEPRPDEELPLPNQADGTANISVGWENEKFSFRASYNWRDEILSGINGDEREDLIREAYGAYDINIRYNITPNYQLYLDGINLGEERDERVFRGDATTGRLFSRIEDYGRTIQLGISGNF